MRSPSDASQLVPMHIQCDIVSKVLVGDIVSPKPMRAACLKMLAGGCIPFGGGASTLSCFLLAVIGFDRELLETVESDPNYKIREASYLLF